MINVALFSLGLHSSASGYRLSKHQEAVRALVIAGLVSASLPVVEEDQVQNHETSRISAEELQTDLTSQRRASRVGTVTPIKEKRGCAALLHWPLTSSGYQDIYCT